MQWTPSSWDARSSDYTTLPQLSLSHDRDMETRSRPANTLHVSGYTVEKESHTREAVSLQYLSDIAPSQSNGAFFENYDTNSKYVGPAHDSASERGRHYQPRGQTRSRSSQGKTDWSGSPRVTPAEGTVKTPKRHHSPISSSTLLHARAQALSQALACDITNGTSRREDIEAAIKERLKDILIDNSSCSPDVGQGALDTKNHFKCDQCFKTLKRHCDLKYVPKPRCMSNVIADSGNRKHKKRHTRPYGCTYAGCSKRFGSKNDWKRHENTRHYQIEAWRCQEPNSTSKINQCAKVFYRREQYQAHLKDHHKLQDEGEVRKRSQKNRIGRNGQSGFWCGFCQKIVTLSKRGLEAWDERFDHIDRQHFHKDQTIDQWYPLDKDLPLGEMLPSDSINTDPSPAVDEDDSEGEDSSDEAEQDDSPISGMGDEPQLRPPASSKRMHNTAVEAHGSNKRQARERIWYCVSYGVPRIRYPTDSIQCRCQDGPHSMKLEDSCMRCSQHRCSNCDTRTKDKE